MRLFFRIMIWILIIAAVLFLLLMFWIETHTSYGAGSSREGNELVSWTYSLSGSDTGGSYLLSAEYDGKSGKAKLREEKKATFDSRGKVRTRKTDGALLDSIAGTVERLSMTGWQELELSEIIALDAATARVTFSYADGRNYSFTDRQDLPDGWREGVDSINSLILEALG